MLSRAKNTPFSAAAGIVLRFTMGHCRALPLALARLSCICHRTHLVEEKFSLFIDDYK